MQREGQGVAVLVKHTPLLVCSIVPIYVTLGTSNPSMPQVVHKCSGPLHVRQEVGRAAYLSDFDTCRGAHARQQSQWRGVATVTDLIQAGLKQ